MLLVLKQPTGNHPHYAPILIAGSFWRHQPAPGAILGPAAWPCWPACGQRQNAQALTRRPGSPVLVNPDTTQGQRIPDQAIPESPSLRRCLGQRGGQRHPDPGRFFSLFPTRIHLCRIWRGARLRRRAFRAAAIRFHIDAFDFQKRSNSRRTCPAPCLLWGWWLC